MILVKYNKFGTCLYINTKSGVQFTRHSNRFSIHMASEKRTFWMPTIHKTDLVFRHHSNYAHLTIGQDFAGIEIPTQNHYYFLSRFCRPLTPQLFILDETPYLKMVNLTLNRGQLIRPGTVDIRKTKPLNNKQC